MNNSNKLLTLALVAATTGLAAFGLTNTEFAARLPLEGFLAVTVSLGLVRVAFSDYARRPLPLHVPPAAPRGWTRWWRCARIDGTSAASTFLTCMQRLRLLLTFAALPLLASAAVDPAAFAAAVKLFNERKPLEARQAFAALAAADAGNADVQYYLGRIALQRDEAEKAVTYLEQAIALSPADARYHHRLGDAYGRSAQKAGMFSKMGLAGKCRTAYEKAVELDPKNIDARFSLLGFYQQAPGIGGGGIDKALGQAQEIKRLDPARGRLAIAGVYVIEKKYAEAFAEFDEALKQKPGDYAALFQTGRLAAITGERLAGGLEALRQCLAQTPPESQPGHAAAHWRIGNILEKQNDRPGARAAYEAALKVDPKFPQAIESLKKL